jgi:hypothetical protein
MPRRDVREAGDPNAVRRAVLLLSMRQLTIRDRACPDEPSSGTDDPGKSRAPLLALVEPPLAREQEVDVPQVRKRSVVEAR